MERNKIHYMKLGLLGYFCLSYFFLYLNIFTFYMFGPQTTGVKIVYKMPTHVNTYPLAISINTPVCYRSK